MKLKEQSESLGAHEVADYLREHPDFFETHLDLLGALSVPHPSGDAVSLVARQLDLLRERNQRMTRQLEELVQIARDNDALHQRVHQLTLTLIDARSLEDVLGSLDWGLHQFFQADFVAVRILDPAVDTPVQGLFVDQTHAQRPWCQRVIERETPVCGPLEPEPLAFLFGENATVVASLIVVRLDHAGLKGVFAIGSRDSERFRRDMGFEFLRQLGETLAARLAVLLNPVP